MIRAHFLSDLHLNGMEDPNAVTLLKFLTKSAKEATYVILLGDIFDMWIAHHKFFISRYKPLVDAISALTVSGVKVHFFEGNHDLYLKKFWQDHLGVIVHPDEAHFEWDGIKIRCEHGDMMNPDDTNYFILRKFLRSKLMVKISHLAPGLLAKEVGERSSRLSRKYSRKSDPDKESRIKKMMNTYALKCAEHDNFNVLITGHTHVRADYEFEANQTRRFINLGSWLNEPPHILTYENKKFTWHNL